MALPLLRSPTAPARRPSRERPETTASCNSFLFVRVRPLAVPGGGPAPRPSCSPGRFGRRRRASSFYGGYYGYYDPFFWGYGGWYPYGLYAPDDGADIYGRSMGSARIQVTPNHAEVYVDGHLAGTVDDFDGFLQRLDVPAGEHELTLYLDGYRTIHQMILFRPGATLKINYAMEALPQGAPNEPRPQPNPDSLPDQSQPVQGRSGTTGARSPAAGGVRHARTAGAAARRRRLRRR